MGGRMGGVIEIPRISRESCGVYNIRVLRSIFIWYLASVALEAWHWRR